MQVWAELELVLTWVRTDDYPGNKQAIAPAGKHHFPLVTTLHKLGPKTLYHSYSPLTIDVEKDFSTEENSVKCKKKGREFLISVFNIQFYIMLIF